MTPRNAADSVQNDQQEDRRGRLDRLGRARLSFVHAVIGLAVLVLAGAALGLMLARSTGREQAPAGPPAGRGAEQLAPAAGASPLPTVDDPFAPTATLVVARPAPYPTGLPTPVSRAGAAAQGPFELGGQVAYDLRHAGQMRQAGMTWVKVDVAWRPGQNASAAGREIEQAQRAGFRVLVSVAGEERRPEAIDTAAYLDFLDALARYSPDAVEVWSEPNTAERWPEAEIDGGQYVRGLLAPAYNVVKAASRNTMVISGAPRPTGDGGEGVFYEQMAAAGGGNYLDCTGVRYLAGAEPPGESASFQQALQPPAEALGKPVCFVAFGYLSGEGFGPVPPGYDWAGSTTAADQSAWLAEAARLGRDDPRIRLMIVWNVDYLTWRQGAPAAGYALIRPDGSCPACEALGEVMAAP